MEWKDPPGASWGLTEEAAALRRRPGQWAVVIVPEPGEGPQAARADRQRQRGAIPAAGLVRDYPAGLRGRDRGTVRTLYRRGGRVW